MIEAWIAGHDPDRVFLEGGGGTVTYGQLSAAGRTGTGQVVVTPGTEVESVVELMVVPSATRQLVVVDPGLPYSESQRRIRAARSAIGRPGATVLFTSGTSGPAKAVRLTSENWGAAVTASARHLGHGPEDVWLAAMPLHHVGGLSILYRSAYVGGSVRWLPRFDLDEVISALRGDVTMASLVPTMLQRVLARDSGAYHGLKAVLIGGGPIPDGLVEAAHARGIPALPTYGMTETCAQVATLRPGSEPRRAAHLLPGVEIRLGDGGRIEVRGDQVSPGYADTDDRPAGGWFPTPDRGAFDGDGALLVLGRVDDVVVTGGENVDPGQVEAAMAAHPQVTAAAVAGVPDPEWGMRLVGVYAGEPRPEELLEWLRERLARFQVPRELRRVDSIPSRGIGKPDRDRIRSLFTAD